MDFRRDRDTHRLASLASYVNESTIRGAALVGVGIFALAAPRTSHFLLGLAVALGLVVFGTTGIRAGWRARPKRWLSILVGLLYLAGAVVLALRTDETVRLVSLIAGVALILRGLVGAFGAIRDRSSSPTWTYDMVRGFLWIAFGTIVFLIPEAIITGSIFAIAAIAIVSGAITLSVGLSEAHRSSTHHDVDTIAYFREWFNRRDIGEDLRTNVIESLFFEQPDAAKKHVGFWVLLVLSTAIATLGVMADSTAVVIGAMIVAPLMTPIMAASAAIVNGWPRRVSIAFATVAGGVIVSVGVAWILAAWVPQFIPTAANSQIQARIAPTLIDLLIAVVAGAAGAYTTIDKRVSSSIAGVAIAVALVPPLSVVGVMLKVGAFSDAVGAFLLFSTNLVAIVLAASVVFVAGGLVSVDHFRRNRRKTRTAVATVLFAALVIVIPLFFTSEGIIASATRQSTAQQVAEDWLATSEGLSLIRLQVSGDNVAVTISGEGDIPSVADLDAALDTALNADMNVNVEYFPSIHITSAEH